MHVLVVDDEPGVRALVLRVLVREGFDVSEAEDARGGLARADQAPVDIAVLDLDLPGMSGFDLMRELRRTDPGIGVLMLTGSGSEADRVTGLVGGADDYVVKPFSPAELGARVIALSRRRASGRPLVIEHGHIRLDVSTWTATANGAPLDLTRREFELLRHLMSNAGRTFSREDLLHAVWGSSAEWQGTATVTEHIRRLRSKIDVDPTSRARIMTVRGVGYHFDPNAEG